MHFILLLCERTVQKCWFIHVFLLITVVVDLDWLGIKNWIKKKSIVKKNRKKLLNLTIGQLEWLPRSLMSHF